MAHRDSGNGPQCPAGFMHGRLMSRDRGGDPSKGWRCPHSDHGGNGRAFTDAEATAYEMKESDVNSILEQAARAVASGKIDLETAVVQAARQIKRSQDHVRSALTTTVEAIQAEAQQKEAEMAENEKAKAAKAPKTKAAKEPKAPSARSEHVEPAEFAAVRDALGMRNKEVSAALAAAGQGSTLSRVTELTHSKGSSRALFEKFTAALNAWREANPATEAPAAEETEATGPADEPAAE